MFSLLCFSIFLLLLNNQCSCAQLKCDFSDVVDTFNIYTCDLSSDLNNNIEEVHLNNKNNSDVKSVKYDGFGNDAITNLDLDICQKYKNLEIIRLFSAKIESIDENLLKGCKNLKILSLALNEIQEIPENLFVQNSKLTILSLEQNNLTTLPENVFSNLNDLEELNLNKNQIDSLSANFFKSLINIRLLSLEGNKITKIDPTWFKNLQKLEVLKLSNNEILKLEENVFGSLINLLLLELGQNQITNLHQNAFCNLKNLQELNLDNNKISNLPSNVFVPLVKLKVLSLGDNGIRSLPNNIFSPLIKLEELKLWGNVLKNIYFESFGKLPHLTTIDLDNNNIEFIAEKFIYTTNITRLYMDGNVCFSGVLETRDEVKEKSKICFKIIDEVSFNFIDNLDGDLLEPSTVKSVIQKTKTLTLIDSTWNLLDPSINDACGRPKMGFGTAFYGNQVGHGAFPWIAALIRKDGLFFCGGTLVSRSLIITAAHCIEGKRKQYHNKPEDILVVLGANNMKKINEKGKITVKVRATHIHHDWNPYIDSYDADIAILELEDEVNFNRFIQPICVLEAGSVPALKTHGIVAGFGKSEFADVQDIARLVSVPIHDKQKCYSSNNVFDGLLSHRGFCGGYANGTGVCTGDSGSGLIVIHNNTYYLRGIVSASLIGPLNGCNLKAYSMFTDVLEFTGWIKVGTDDKTLIQQLLEKVRKCELENNQLKKMKTLPKNRNVIPNKYDGPPAANLQTEPEGANKQTTKASSRIVFPDD